MNTFLLLVYLISGIFSNTYIDKKIFKHFEQLSNKELLYNYNTKTHTDTLRALAHVYLERAKKQGNIENIARGYDFQARLYDYQTNQKYADSLIEVSSGLTNNRSYPAIGYLLKGYQFYYQDLFIDALVQFEKAQEFIAEDDFDKLITTRIALGAIHMQLGVQSIDYSIETAELINKHVDVDNDYSNDLFYIYQSLAYSYLDLRDFKKAKYYFKKEQFIAENASFPVYLELLNLDKGILAYEEQNYEQALLYLSRVDESQLESSKFASYLLIKGESNRLLGNKNAATVYFTKADSLYSSDSILPQDLHLAYNFLINEANKLNDIEQQNYYTQQFLEVQLKEKMQRDQLMGYIQSKRKGPMSFLFSDNVPQVIDSDKYQFWIIQLLIISFGFLAISLLTFFNSNGRLSTIFSRFLVDAYLINLFKKKNVSIPSYNNIQILDLKQNEVTNKVDLDIGIDYEVVKSILDKLTIFEKKKSFIKYGKLKEVADHLNTNSSYLSKIVNAYKDCSFGNYIHKLRVSEVVLQLDSNPVLKSYTIDAISKEFGYNSVESFSRAFKREVGLKPSLYLKKIR